MNPRIHDVPRSCPGNPCGQRGKSRGGLLCRCFGLHLRLGGRPGRHCRRLKGELQTVDHQSLLPGGPTATQALSFSGSISAARLRRTIFSHSGKPPKQRSFPSPRTNRGSCTSLWPPILMATSFVSSMISGATCKRTTHRARSGSALFRNSPKTGAPTCLTRKR
jgi:hypothetical protein